MVATRILRADDGVCDSMSVALPDLTRVFEWFASDTGANINGKLHSAMFAMFCVRIVHI